MLPLIYEELRRLAHAYLRGERSDHTLQPTPLVNELYLQLAKQHGGRFKDRGHFFTFAAMLMRRILADYAKRIQAGMRGGGLERVPLSDDLPWLVR
jgi:RNA polymerase sigma-70 factor (ECF subfamily)